jgi:putative nucleotidyltransferase with HDIG domain
MSLRQNLKLLRGGLAGDPPAGPSAATLAARGLFERSRIVTALIFLATVAAIVVISYVGVSTVNLPVLPGQLATVRVAANSSFSYVSQERTRASSEALRNRVPPVYRLELEAFQRFERDLRDLLTQLERFERAFPPNTPNVGARTEALTALVEEFNLRGSYRAAPEDVMALLGAGDAKLRLTLVESGLTLLRELNTEGIHDGTLDQAAAANSVTVFQVLRPTGEIAPRPVQSLEQALTYLRANLTAEGPAKSFTPALFRILRSGLAPNLAFDAAATKAREALALKALKPVSVAVERGQTIIEPDTRVTAEQYEMLMAQRQHLLETGDTGRDADQRLFGRVLLVLAMVIACTFYIRLEDRETFQSNGRLALLALVVIANLALVRLTYSLLDLQFFQQNSAWASTLPYIAPTALAPLIVAILIDAGSGIFMALLISIFTGVIYGNRLDLLVVTFLASMVAISTCRDVSKRGRVVRAAGAGGFTVAAFAAVIGLAEGTDRLALLLQMGAGLASGLLTGVLVVGMLPVLESLFKRTTDITLLELTDFNHPLLRRMQIEAPGTYHHSLVVAQLAENACNAIGANPLLARICALFHDIGKIAHPEFFTENQRTGTNPHDGKAPAESARIIKAHVTDGLDLARRHRLPRAVSDVIRQHHGTTLIRFFYLKACGHGTVPPVPGSSVPFTGPATTVPEEGYRYDGPRPQSKESAVISLADAVEAATRSLRHVTPENLGELVDALIRDRIAEHQFDEAPLTFSDLTQVKNSFVFTLLNMLHSRTAYPGMPAAPGVEAKA